MKFLKALGGLLCFIGCLAALAGILATAVPMIDNEQVRRILESFSAPSTDRLINGINGVLLFCLKQNYVLFGAGIGVLLAGGLMRTGAERALFRESDVRPQETAPARAPERNRRSDRTVPPATTAAPNPPMQPKAKDGLSPYAAAEYGKALNRSGGRETSEIAEKYMPRSIIDTPSLADEPESTAGLGTWADRAPKPPESAVPAAAGARAFQPSTSPEISPTEPERKDSLKETVRDGVAAQTRRFCSKCGAPCASDALFCSQCGTALSDGTRAGSSLIRAEVMADSRPAETVASTKGAGPSEWRRTPAGAEIGTPPAADYAAGGAQASAPYAVGHEPIRRKPRIVSTLADGLPETPQPPPEPSEESRQTVPSANAVSATSAGYGSAQPSVHTPANKPRIVSTMGRKRTD